ncbi:gliding motility-associated C-terminal domain-containing protein [Danxiaibacter flavus]|uniref:Gliding motility-associated C-terminal domain-containing protein n=1 Tax=Danxiaibacter flavus TaxID=3049108 RepID=A0ABV3ZDP7_9BACT|nr:gliding motility-associated C-terminal domain-containing protein [Chitinophagaceae bacterium DXS]
MHSNLKTIYSSDMCSSRIIAGAFTPFLIAPASAGSMDKLVLKYHEKVNSIHLKIFTRWGSVIYETDNYDNSWDGDNVSAGTYYYEAAVSSPALADERPHRGWIVVVK